MTESEAADLIDRAVDAENDMDLRRLYEATTDGSHTFEEWIGTLSLLDRIRKIGGVSAPSEMGAAFRAAGMEMEARDYLVDAHNATPFVASLYGCDVWHVAAATFREYPPIDRGKGKSTKRSRRKKISSFASYGDHIIAAAGGSLTEKERSKEALLLRASLAGCTAPRVARNHDRIDVIRFVHRLRQNAPWLIRQMLEFASGDPARPISVPSSISRIYLVGQRTFGKVIAVSDAVARLQGHADRAAQVREKRRVPS